MMYQAATQEDKHVLKISVLLNVILLALKDLLKPQAEFAQV